MIEGRSRSEFAFPGKSRPSGVQVVKETFYPLLLTQLKHKVITVILLNWVLVSVVLCALIWFHKMYSLFTLLLVPFSAVQITWSTCHTMSGMARELRKAG